MRTCLPIGLSLALTSVLACKPSPDDDTVGELGKVGFHYQRSCFFGCPLGQPLLVGTREQIQVSKSGSDAVDVRTHAADVASFALTRTCYCERTQGADRIEVAEDAKCEKPRVKRCEVTVAVFAQAEGDADFELLDQDDQVIDRSTVFVREADRARLYAQYAGDVSREVQSLSLSPGDKADVELRLYDARGQRLLAPEGVHWHSDDARVAHVAAWLLGSGGKLDAGLSIVVEALEHGDTEIGLDVPGLQTSIPLQVR